MLVQSWIDVLVSSLQSLYIQVVGFLPSLLGALIVFVVGLIVAFGLDKLVEGGELYCEGCHLRLIELMAKK